MRLKATLITLKLFWTNIKKNDDHMLSKLLASIFFFAGSLIAYYNTTSNPTDAEIITEKTFMMIRAQKKVAEGKYYLARINQKKEILCFLYPHLIEIKSIKGNSYVHLKRKPSKKLMTDIFNSKSTDYLKSTLVTNVNNCKNHSIIYSPN
jgi:hypothetical protein